MQINNYINALPDIYKKPNNRKLLSIEQASVQGLRDDIQAVHDTLDILKATGKTLDLYGAIYKQARGSLTDDQYRYMILQKAARYFVGCDHDSIVNALAAVFGVSPDKFKIEETGAPCEVTVKSLPFSVLSSVGITASQARDMIEAMLAVGVRLDSVNFEGTFEFGDSADEKDEDKGFSNIEHSTGGYFGYLSSGGASIPKS